MYIKWLCLNLNLVYTFSKLSGVFEPQWSAYTRSTPLRNSLNCTKSMLLISVPCCLWCWRWCASSVIVVTGICENDPKLFIASDGWRPRRTWKFTVWLRWVLSWRTQRRLIVVSNQGTLRSHTQCIAVSTHKRSFCWCHELNTDAWQVEMSCSTKWKIMIFCPPQCYIRSKENANIKECPKRFACNGDRICHWTSIKRTKKMCMKMYN